MAPVFAVYYVHAQPPQGWVRAYVGCIKIGRWGADADSAVKARVDSHMKGDSHASAAWLKICTLKEWGVLDTCSTFQGATALELMETLKKMKSHGDFLTRGGPYCRIAIDWPEVERLKYGVQMWQKLGDFQTWLQAVPLSEDMKRHLSGKCYNCGKSNHFTQECGVSVLAPHMTEEARQRKYAAYFRTCVPSTKAIYFVEDKGRSRYRWQYHYKNKKGGKVSKRYVDVSQDITDIHWGALRAHELCNVLVKEPKARPKSASTQPLKKPKTTPR